MKLTFLGGVGTVTGSRTLVQAGGRRVLVDCGMFQGPRELRRLNRDPFGFEPAEIDDVVLTHAHIDHSGLVPRLVKEGFAGRVTCTPATRALCSVLLPDSGRIQEEEARYAARGGWSRHAKPVPIYNQREAEESLDAFRSVDFEQGFALGDGVEIHFRSAAHIPGAASVLLTHDDRRVLFSGDIGRLHRIAGRPPRPPVEADALVIESTYGDRLHGRDDPFEIMADIVNRTVERGGVVLVPAFAVGRAQMLMYILLRLRKDGRIPGIPVWVDSPMAAKATSIARRHCEEDGIDPNLAEEILENTRITRTVQESKQLDDNPRPMVLISASGMATGGRVLHHIKALGRTPRNTILFAGYQAPGTRGADLVAGRRVVKIHGEEVQVRAEVDCLDVLSAHADRDELLTWLGQSATPPGEVLINHGEPEASAAFAEAVHAKFDWPVRVAAPGMTVDVAAR